MNALSITRLASLTLAAAAAACGGDPLDPGAGDDPGSGTSTLQIEGRAAAEPRTRNAPNAVDFDTDFEIRARLSGQPVTSGTVSVTSRFESVPLTYDAQEGTWKGRMAGYDEVYRLDVISGADKVEGVIVDGPDIHLFTAPTAGASLDATVANTITWSREEQADTITFQADNIDRIQITDTGTYSMAPGSLKSEKDTARDNVLELRRTNTVTPAGATAGSTFSVSIQQELDVIALPNPAA